MGAHGVVSEFARQPALLAAFLIASIGNTAHSEEGMWPPAQIPFAHVERIFGVKLGPEVVERVQLATIRFGGATAFFVSPSGLVITNHHVALRCLQNLSTPERNYYSTGFLAGTTFDELRCPGQDARVLISYADVTTQFERLGSPSSPDRERAGAQLQADLEDACARQTGLTCEVVSFYGGAQQMLYRYKKYDDIRLVAAPEAAVAYFGGTSDNFEYPRHNLDVTLLRVYESGRPVTPPAYLRMAAQVSTEGDLAIGAGHPHRTSRWLPVPQLELLRDVRLPFSLAHYERRIKLLEDYRRRSRAAMREASLALFYTRNSQKREAGYLAALADPKLIRTQDAIFERLAAALTDDARKQALAGLVVSATRIAEAERELVAKEYLIAHNIGSRLFEWAVLLVRWADEASRAEATRLQGFRGARLRATETWITSKTPAFPAMEAVLMADRWIEAAQVLGAGHPYVREVASVKPDEVLGATALGDAEVRQSLLKAGPKAIRESNDPLLVLARRLEPHLYGVRARYEKEVVEPLARLEAEFARLRMATSAGSYAPDANGTLRFSFGRIASYRESAVEQPWSTTFHRMYERADLAGNKRPEALPRIWHERRAAMSLDGPYHFVSTVDHSGGNSGSPVVNEKGEWFGVQHDGNRHNFGTQYVYSGAQARAIALHSVAILEWLRAIVGANDLIKELVGSR
jgi:hypothetical protein